MGRKLVPFCLMGIAIASAGIVLGAMTAPAGADPLARPAPSKSASGADITVDGSQRFQRIDGFGVNANPKNWSAYPQPGGLGPALDLLVNDLGATLWRVDVFGNSNWEATNDNADPFTPDWNYFNNLYGTNPYFQDLWSTLARLNADGIQPILSASGVVPGWMGGTQINNDDEFVETFATLLYYARNTKHIQFTWADPLNETDKGQPEGPLVDASEFDTILAKLRARLVSMNMSDVRLIAPETTRPNSTYDGAILADTNVAPYVAAYAGHAYTPADVSSLVSQIKSSANPAPNFWVTEYSSTLYGFLDGGQQVPDEWAFTKDMENNLFSFLSTGASAALVWDAYDNYHDHAQSFTYWGLLATLSNYAPKKRYYGAKQVFAYVKPGSVRVQATSTQNGVTALAFVNDATGTVTIVGMNTNSGSQALTGSISNFSAPSSLTLYQTTSTLNAANGGSVAVNAGNFTVTVAGDSIFTLTGSSCGIICATPTPSPTPSATRSVGGIADVAHVPPGSQASGSSSWPWLAAASGIVALAAAGVVARRRHRPR